MGASQGMWRLSITPFRTHSISIGFVARALALDLAADSTAYVLARTTVWEMSKPAGEMVQAS